MGFWKKLFGDDDEDRNVSSETNPIMQSQNSREDENKVITLDDVGNFVAEIQSYYVNDNFKLQSDYISDSQCEIKANFLQKKLYYEKMAENRITSILKEIRKIEASSRAIWGKSIYSFYEELEKNQMETVYNQVFSLIIQLRAVNAKKELDPIILARLEKYRNSWNISQTIEIPESLAINIISVDEEKEVYQIGTHNVEVKANQNVKRILNDSESDKIANMEFELEFENPSEFFMIKFASITRKQMNLLSKTAILPNNWQYGENNKACFFVVKRNELEHFVKSITQMILPFNQYLVISIMNLNSYMKSILQNNIIEDNKKIELKNIFTFVWKERGEEFKDNWKVAYIKRKYIPKKLVFQNFNELRKNFK